jgi:hypothetical protein
MGILSPSNGGNIERTGMALLLLAAGFEIFVLGDAESTAATDRFTGIAEQFRSIWIMLGKMSADPKIASDYYHQSYKLFFVRGNWGGVWDGIADTVRYIGGGIFLLGSALVILGHWLREKHDA